MSEDQPRLYSEFAAWFHLLTAPADYAAEAAVYRGLLDRWCRPPPRTVLELGSGGGNNASHLKQHYRLTLTDASPEMLAISQALNPECEHVQGDMRSLRLGRVFDAVFVHDAVMYMTTAGDLQAVMETAALHCREGGVALFVPDCARETFEPYTRHGGHDGEGRSLRYLEWARDPDPADATYEVDFAFLLREEGRPLRLERDHHVFGVFPRQAWLDMLATAGFEPHQVTRSEEPREMFVGVKPAR